jgi:hypothetical protein
MFKVVHHSGPQDFGGSVREAECACLGYMTRLSRLHVLDPH